MNLTTRTGKIFRNGSTDPEYVDMPDDAHPVTFMRTLIAEHRGQATTIQVETIDGALTSDQVVNVFRWTPEYPCDISHECNGHHMLNEISVWP